MQGELGKYIEYIICCYISSNGNNSVTYFQCHLYICRARSCLLTNVCFICRAEIARLQRINEMKTREMNRVKRLAKTILDQVRKIISFLTFLLVIMKKLF